MPSTTALLGFVVASLFVLVTPGPGVLYVVARGASQGYRAGLASAVGLSAGAFLHVAAAAAGLSAIMLASATAFTVVKILGAGYLIYLGMRILLSKRPVADVNNVRNASLKRLFVDGVFISAFNPKIAIFFLAFLPQFVQADRGSITKQIWLLGIVYVVLALATDGTYAIIAGRLRHTLRGAFMQRPIPRYASGLIYVGLGINAALVGRRN